VNHDIIITGASGFLGSHLIKHFSAQGFGILAIGRQSKLHPSLKGMADYISLELRESIPSLQAAICIHTAGLADEKASLADLKLTNLMGTQQLFEKVNCDHFIHISSASVYSPSMHPHSENQALVIENLSRYGQSKALADQYLLKQTSKKTQITILRPRAIYGIGDRVLLPRILRLIKGRFFFQPQPMQYEISMTSIKNVILALDTIIESKISYGQEVFNIADPVSYDLGKVITLLANHCSDKDLLHVGIPEQVIGSLGKLFPQSNFGPEVMRFFLCHHQLDTRKFNETFQVPLPHTFDQEVASIGDWVKKIGLGAFRRNLSDLPFMG
jgi:nucleoside-diphosphate-sugar epimerase